MQLLHVVTQRPKASYHAGYLEPMLHSSFVNLVTADLAEIYELERILGFNLQNNSIVICEFRHVYYIIDAWIAGAFDRTLCQTDARNDRTCDLLTRQIANDRP